MLVTDCMEPASLTVATSVTDDAYSFPSRFERYDYTCESGRSGGWHVCGFSPRAQNTSIYIMPGFRKFEKKLGRPGKFKTARSCLYIKRLDDVDQKILSNLIAASVKEMRRKYLSG